ncbi:MAG: hypothetical protein HYU36_12400 [Planctomycetes bacterium]|nr:hypothetical protein [Planctomycetota bacterium]
MSGALPWWPLYALGAAGLLLALVPSAWLAWRVTLRFRDRAHQNLAPAPGLARILLAFTASCLGSVLFALAVCLAVHFHGYQSLTSRHLAAEIECLGTLGPESFEVLFTPVRDGERDAPRRFVLKGDQWSIGADVLQWRPFMHALGFHTVYKVTRLEGRYLLASGQARKPITAYDLNGGTDAAWLGLYQGGRTWPYRYFVEAVYGNAVYQFPEVGSVYKIYVTASGLMAVQEPRPTQDPRRPRT